MRPTPKKRSAPAPYVCITKVGTNPDGSTKCVKYHVSNLVKYAAYLDTHFPKWAWTNVYAGGGHKVEQGKQVGNFTNNNRPTGARMFG